MSKWTKFIGAVPSATAIGGAALTFAGYAGNEVVQEVRETRRREAEIEGQKEIISHQAEVDAARLTEKDNRLDEVELKVEAMAEELKRLKEEVSSASGEVSNASGGGQDIKSYPSPLESWDLDKIFDSYFQVLYDYFPNSHSLMRIVESPDCLTVGELVCRFDLIILLLLIITILTFLVALISVKTLNYLWPHRIWHIIYKINLLIPVLVVTIWIITRLTILFISFV